MEIRVEDHISDEERQRLFGWGEDIFGANHLSLKWRPKDWHIFVDVEGSPATHVGLLRHTVTVDEHPVEVCGVGGVVTAIDSHGKGYATRAMRHAQDFMRREWAVDFGLLFCFERLVPFYERLGWQRVDEDVWIEHTSGRINSPMVVMILPCKAKKWPAGMVKLNSFPW